MSVSWSVFLPLFLFECLYQCSAVFSLILILLVLLLIHVSLSLSVSVCGYHIGNFSCTSLDSYFFLSDSVWIRLPVSGYTTTHCRCICKSLDPSFYLCFSECLYYCSAMNYLTDCTCICTSLDPPFSLSFFQHPDILSIICMDMNKRVQLTQRVVALYILFFSSFCVDMYVSWFVFLSFSLNVCSSLRVYSSSL